MRIALGHQARTGKDTCADYIVAKYGGVKMAISDPVYTVAEHVQRAQGMSMVVQIKTGLVCAFCVSILGSPHRHGLLCDTIATILARNPGSELKKDRDLLRDIGMGMRDVYGSDVWINHLLGRLPAQGNVVVSDVKFLNEYQLLVHAGFTMIKVVRPERPYVTPHISETELAETTFDYVIINNSTLMYFGDRIDDVIALIK